MAEFLRKKGLRLKATDIGDGVTRISLSSRLSRFIGMKTICFLVGDILIDSAFSHGGKLLIEYLADKEFSAIALTHNHEDHSGNCGALARAHECPIYLAHPEKKDEEGVGKLVPYRSIGWGSPTEYQPEPMPEKIESGGRTLRVLPTPGHSQTHVVFFEEATGLLFAGDIYITGGVTAVMSHENPYQSIESLRRTAELKPRRMFNGHGLTIDDPAEALLQKADKLEAAARQVLEMHHQGASHRRIQNAIFKTGRAKDFTLALMTGEEFSRRCFVKACIAHRTPECGS
jgi:glyoxylase-like metal-dependent hydrolase (beta-lactamase superfamily II)